MVTVGQINKGSVAKAKKTLLITYECIVLEVVERVLNYFFMLRLALFFTISLPIPFTVKKENEKSSKEE